MKKTTTLLFALGFSMASMAQITIDSTDFGSIGDRIVSGRQVQPLSITIGGQGQQTWDFTSLIIENFSNNIFQDPSVNVLGAEFPTATINYQASTLNTFFKVTASSIETVGFFGDVGSIVGNSTLGVNVSIPFENPQTLLELPANFGDSFTDTSYFDKTVSAADFNIPPAIADSVWLIHNATSTNELDAYGTLTMINETHEVLRKKRVEYFVDTIWIKTAAGSWQMIPAFPPYFNENPRLDTLITYEWYAKGKDFPIAIANTNAAGDIIDIVFNADSMLFAEISSLGSVLCNADTNGVLTAGVEAFGTSPYTYQWSNGSTGPQIFNASAGDYYVTVTDVNGKKGVAYSEMIEPTALVIEDSVTRATCAGCFNGAIYLQVSGGTPPYTYAWEGSDTAITSFRLGLQVEDYTVTVTDLNGCSKEVIVAVTAIPVGIEDILSQSNTLVVYPNPSQTEVFVNASRVEVYDVLGAKLFTQQLNGKALNVSVLTKGIYFVVDAADKTRTQRLIVQ